MMRLRAGVGLLCAVLAGCQHLPEGVVVDVGNGVVAAGPCTCRLPVREAPVQDAQEEPAPDAPR